MADFGLSKILFPAEAGQGLGHGQRRGSQAGLGASDSGGGGPGLECSTDATGTIAYMAPEVLDGRQCAASDVYRWGPGWPGLGRGGWGAGAGGWLHQPKGAKEQTGAGVSGGPGPGGRVRGRGGVQLQGACCS